MVSALPAAPLERSLDLVSRWVHAVAEDGFLYSFDLGKGELGHLLKARELPEMQPRCSRDLVERATGPA